MKDTIMRLNRNPRLSPWFDQQLDALIDSGVYTHTPEKLAEALIRKLEKYRRDHNIDRVVIGMSGGIDSTLTANLFKLAGWQVYPMILPIYQDPEETGRGIVSAEMLGAEPYVVRDLGTLYDRCVHDMASDCHLSLADDTLEAAKRRGNVRARLRMITLYDRAAEVGGLVASTDNFSELAAGFWTLHGDVGDVAPIQSLTKSWEVPAIAESLDTVPACVVQAKPTDGLGIANGDEDQFGFSYLEFDIALLSLINGGFQDEDSALESDWAIVEAVKRRVRSTRHKRNNPHNLDHPTDKNRYKGLSKLDTALVKQLGHDF